MLTGLQNNQEMERALRASQTPSGLPPMFTSAKEGPMRRIPRTFSIDARCVAVFLRDSHRAESLRDSSILIGQSGQEATCSTWGDAACWAVAATAA
jgi:hypothetical protein